MAVCRHARQFKSKQFKQEFLYSDQDMGWMVQESDFLLKWLSLMSECVRQGIRIRIIHNIERNTNKMISAITAVHISKTDPPYLSFTFLHPLMCETFRAYAKEMG